MKRKAPGGAELGDRKGKQRVQESTSGSQASQGVSAVSVAPRVYCQALCSGFARLYEQRHQFSDVTLLANGVPGHRVVLSAWSSVFCAMLERWVGDRGEHPTILVELPGECKLCDFLELLRFMYVGSCSISSANCTALLQLSNFYQVLPLKSAVGDYLLSALDARNLVTLFELADEFDMRRLRSALVAQLALNFDALVDAGGLVSSLAMDVWRDVLRADALSVQSEEAVLGMVLACTAARPGARQKAEAIAALLPCVRMPQLNVHALVHGVEANALLMAQPVTCVLLCLAYRTITKVQLLARGLLQQAQLLERRPPAYAMRPHGPGPPPRPAAAAVASPPSDAASGGSAGSGSSGAAQRGAAGDAARAGDRASMWAELLAAQCRKRAQLCAFDPFKAPGMAISEARLTATAVPAPGINHAAGGPGGSRVCCATVVPGLRHGVHCIELAIKRAPPALRGVAQLDVWLVYAPDCENNAGFGIVGQRLDSRDQQGAVYVMGGPQAATAPVAEPANAGGPAGPRGAAATGDGRAGSLRLPSGVHTWPPDCAAERGLPVHGVQEGDTIGVHMALRADQSYRHDASRNVHLIGDCATVIFSRNGAVVGRAQHLKVGKVPRREGTYDALPQEGYQVVVATRTPGTSVSLLRRCPQARAGQPTWALHRSLCRTGGPLHMPWPDEEAPGAPGAPDHAGRAPDVRDGRAAGPHWHGLRVGGLQPEDLVLLNDLADGSITSDDGGEDEDADDDGYEYGQDVYGYGYEEEPYY